MIGDALGKDAQDLLFRAARTANTFTADPVTADQVRHIVDLIRFGPTALNAQPLRVLLLASPEARARLIPLLSEGNRTKTGSAPLTAVLAADTSFHERLAEVFPHRPQARDWFDADEVLREQTARFNAALQIGYFIVGVRAAGLAAGPMAGFDVAGVDEEFFAGTPLRSQLIVNIGRPGPDAWRDRLPRLSVAETVTVI